MTVSFPRGSEWRKWDLHFHTPASKDDYKFGLATPEKLIDTLLSKEIAAVAVTDHHFIDVNLISSMQKYGNGRITVFPGIELRTELGGSSDIHITGIFPEYCNLLDLWTKLSAKLEITPLDVQKKGLDKIYVDLRESAEVIHKLGGVVAIHAGKKTNGIEEIKNRELFKQQLKKDLLAEYVDILEIGRVEDVNGYTDKVFPNIGFILPMCLFSDNHDIREYEGVQCWIKADPTFDGLLQILNEPEYRVYLGEKPPALQRLSKCSTKIIKDIKIEKSTNSIFSEKWFDNTILFNSELISIIGNKGSGKSALADILGLLGNTLNFKNFNFLNEKRFRKDGKARHYQGSITWANGETDYPSNLNEDPDPMFPERVKYIPQEYLETICNEMDSLNGRSNFYDELQNIIFSHITDAERLGFSRLEDLLKHKTEETKESIRILSAELENINNRIVGIEEQSSPQHKKNLEALLKEKERELHAHEQNRPERVPKPDEDPGSITESKQILDNLQGKGTEIDNFDQQIVKLNSSLNELKIRLSKIDKSVSKLKNINYTIENFTQSIELDLEEFGVKIEQLFTYKIDFSILNELRSKIENEIKTIEEKLNKNFAGSITFKREQVLKEIEILKNKLSAPQKKYQEYFGKFKSWEETKNKIIGIESLPGTIVYLNKQIHDLTGLPIILSDLEKNRYLLLLKIYREKRKLRNQYAACYSAVQTFLNDHPIAKERDFKLTFNASIVQKGFEDNFLQFIHQGRIGNYSGVEEGSLKLRTLLSSVDFDSTSGVLRFIKKLMASLREYQRDGKTGSLEIKKQLVDGVSLQEFYQYIFSLEYLDPVYNLKWDGKDVSQLSPGERGNLLLIFYLLVDKNDIPLIIDQPEENLDNQTVYKTLVPCIKYAKKQRQIILVTHNPNLAVVCDSEQIICSEIKKELNFEVLYCSGSIENPIMNKKIIDILEGTRPAFEQRDKKYQ